ncbi:MAG: diguanylate cyclase, partial [Actinobacteria bacterium]|nr:diguanylate cyclase [Actinomycetota bacterium]
RTFGEHTLRPRLSIGLAEIRPGDDVEAAVHKADAAMYQAKSDGGNKMFSGQ